MKKEDKNDSLSCNTNIKWGVCMKEQTSKQTLNQQKSERDQDERSEEWCSSKFINLLFSLVFWVINSHQFFVFQKKITYLKSTMKVTYNIFSIEYICIYIYMNCNHFAYMNIYTHKCLMTLAFACRQHCVFWGFLVSSVRHVLMNLQYI